MNEQLSLEQMIAGVVSDLRAKLGVRGKDLASALNKARHRLPRRIYQLGLTLVAAEPLAGHPKLSLTLDQKALESAAQEISAHLAEIDLAERRKDWWLGALGALSFNLILTAILVIAFLRWRGIV
jgi:hypothetical protein